MLVNREGAMVDEPRVAPLRLRVAIREYLYTRRSDWPVSIAQMRDRVRYVMPELTEPDDALGEMIAAEIIKNGGNVRFDCRAKSVQDHAGIPAGARRGLAEDAGVGDLVQDDDRPNVVVGLVRSQPVHHLPNRAP